MGVPVIIQKDYPLYNPEILKKLNFSESPAKFNGSISSLNPGEPWLCVRPLRPSDYHRGFLELLAQLTDTAKVSQERFNARFEQMYHSGGYYVTVIEDTRSNQIIGSATLVVEQKFIHGCSWKGRLEDVVVNDTYRGKQLGKLIVVTVSLLAKELGCYKMSLDCKDKLIPFYESLGYRLEPGNANAMNIRYDQAASKSSANSS